MKKLNIKICLFEKAVAIETKCTDSTIRNILDTKCDVVLPVLTLKKSSSFKVDQAHNLHIFSFDDGLQIHRFEDNGIRQEFLNRATEKLSMLTTPSYEQELSPVAKDLFFDNHVKIMKEAGVIYVQV